MKSENLKKQIFVGVAVLWIGSAALLFPQVRQVIIGFGERLVGRSLNVVIWHRLIFATALVYFPIITSFLLIFFSKIKIPEIPSEKKDVALKRLEVGLICLYTAMLVFLSLVNNSIWVDEAYSISLIRQSWADLLRLLIIDVHPPFYYSVLKAASLIFGDGIFAMKMVSVFPTILMVVFVSLFLRKEFSHKAALIFLLSCIASWGITYYAIEIRMYSWALFFMTLMAVSAWYFFKSGKKRWWTALLFCALGAAYTQYWAAVAAAIGYLLLFFFFLKYKRDKIKTLLLLAVFAVALYLPWLPILIKQFSQVSNNFWIKPLTVRTVLGYVSTGFSTRNVFVNLFLGFMFAFVFISFFIRKNKTERDFFFFGGLCCAVLLVLSGIFISILIRPLFVGRYLIPVVALVWLFFAVEFSVINRKRISSFICVVLFSIGIMSFSLSAQKEINGNRDFNTFYTYFSEHMQEGDAIIFIPANDTGSLHIVGITKHLFPNSIFTIYSESGGRRLGKLFYELWGSGYTVYEENIFHDRTVWVFVIEESIRVPNTHTQTIGEFSGSFGWDFYRFRLYRRLPFSR